MVGCRVVLDIEYLRDPSFAPRTVYRYRSGPLRSAMRGTWERLAATLGYPLIVHPGRDLIAGLGGFFHGAHFADFGDSRPGAIESAMQAMLRYEETPVAIFVPAGSKVFETATWTQLAQAALVIDEPLATAEHINKIISYALSVSDLSPPSTLGGNPALRSFLLEQSKLSARLDDILLDIDDYILTRLDGAEVGTIADANLRETSLNKAVARYVQNPSTAERRALLTQALLRGDSERLVMGALSIATESYLSRLGMTQDSKFGRVHEAALTWSYALLAMHAKVAALDDGNHPTWRGAPDLRTFAVLDLCACFRRTLGGRSSDAEDLLRQMREATRRVPVLPGSDEDAFVSLAAAIKKLCKSLDGVPTLYRDLMLLLGSESATEAVPSLFGDRLRDIEGQPIAVEHLRQLVRGGAEDGAVLLHGPKSSGAEHLASAFARAVLCEAPEDGDVCGNCVSCREAAVLSSPLIIHVRLAGGLQVKPEGQIEQVRAAVWSRGHWPGKRVVVLIGVDRVRKGAFGRLLKTIEEAPALTSFVFVAERASEVSAALKSRCTIINLKPGMGRPSDVDR